MKKRFRKILNRKTTAPDQISEKFYDNSQLVSYNRSSYRSDILTHHTQLSITEADYNHWLNIYGFDYPEAIRHIVSYNNLDEFINQLIFNTEHRNKTIELSESNIITVKSIFFDNNDSSKIHSEQLIFVFGNNYIWTLQEIVGDHFDHIRERLKNDHGMVRKKPVDYLLYLMLEAIIDNYIVAYEKLSSDNKALKDIDSIIPNPEFAGKVEVYKNNLIFIKKTAASLKDALIQLDKVESVVYNKKYNMELVHQLHYITDEIDQNINHLQSSINLIFSIQNHRLNEVMKTLTIFSVIFIPLTFIAGIYGMNFQNMPELESQYGYYIVIAVMAILGISVFTYFKRKGWF